MIVQESSKTGVVKEWQMLRILYFLDYGKQYGGAVNTLIKQAILMKNAGHDVRFCVSDYYGAGIAPIYRQICTENDIPLEKMTYQISPQPEDIDVNCMVTSYQEVKQKICKYMPMLIHSVQINPLVELVSRELKIPHIMSVYPLRENFFTLPYLDIFPHYHVCDSVYWAEKWNHYLHTDYVCIRTIAFQKQRKKDISTHKKEIFRFVCVGAVYEEKNQLKVIQAVEKLLKAGRYIELDIYGQLDGEYARQCQQYIQEHELGNYIRLMGFVEDMEERYRNYDALICGSTRESYPNVISEAMANEIVVISTPVAGVPEIVQDGINGFLTKDYSNEAIYEKILDYIKYVDQGMIHDIIANTRKTYLRMHSPETVIKELEKFYQYVLTNKEQRSEIDIHQIYAQFDEEIRIYEEHLREFQEPLKVAIKLWYLHYVKQNIRSDISAGRLFYIWGTGEESGIVDDIIRVFFPQLFIKGYIDSYRSGIHNNLPIYQPEQVIQDLNSVIFIAAINGQNEMVDFLNQSGRKYNEDYYILSQRRW